MTRMASTQARTRIVVALFIAAVTLLIARAALAQQSGAAQPSGKNLAAPVPRDDGAPLLTRQHLVPPRPSNLQGVSARRPQAKDAAPALEAANPLFLPVVTYDPGGLGTNAVAVADVNGDSKVDLVVANCEPYGAGICGNNGNIVDGVIAVLLGNGDGTFAPPVAYDSGGANATSVVVADVNGDGKPDLVVTNCGVSGTEGCGRIPGGAVSALLGNGDGTFRPAVSYDSGGISAYSAKVADLNGDGKPDVIFVDFFDTYYNSKSGLVGVLLGNGDGTFQKVVTYPSGQVGANTVAVADVNGDIKPDLVVSNGDCPNTSDAQCAGVLLGNGDGTFQPVVSYKSGGGEVTSIAVADVNGDGTPDLLVTNWCVACANTVGVLLGNGDGTFQVPITYGSGGSFVWSVAVGDVNGDGKPDVLVANQCSGLTFCENAQGLVGVFRNNGEGTFQQVVVYPSGGDFANFLTFADLNGDGKSDIVVSNGGLSPTTKGSVGVLLNNTSFCTANPVITLSTTPTSLWPPTGKMVPVTVSGTITDIGCSVTRAAYAVIDEYGEVQPSGPVTLGAGSAYSFTVLLQASRLGTDLDGRLYTITVSASNNAGKTGSQADAVIVPHDQGH